MPPSGDPPPKEEHKFKGESGDLVLSDKNESDDVPHDDAPSDNNPKLVFPPDTKMKDLYERQRKTSDRDLSTHTFGERHTTDADSAGVVIGVLLTVILVLLGGIVYVAVCKGARRAAAAAGAAGVMSGAPKTFAGGDAARNGSHSLLTRKFTDRFGGGGESSDHRYTPYTSNKVSLYSSVDADPSSYGYHHSSSGPQTQETIYEEPIHNNQLYASSGFLSLNNRKLSLTDDDEEASEEMTQGEDEEDYAEPQVEEQFVGHLRGIFH